MRSDNLISISRVISFVHETDIKRFDHIKINETDFSSDDGVIFLKPEVCNADTNSLTLILEHLQRLLILYHVDIRGIYIISGTFLQANNIINQIYESVKRNALLNIDQNSDNNLIVNGKYDAIVGGLILEKMGYSAKYIIDLWLNAGPAMKIEDQSYGVPCMLDGKRVLLVNGFFPYQMKLYSSPYNKIILFTFKTITSFDILKHNFQGSVDARKRYKVSFRQYLSDFEERYSLGKITSSRNGIHVSGTREEGKREVKIFGEYLRCSSV